MGRGDRGPRQSRVRRRGQYSRSPHEQQMAGRRQRRHRGRAGGPGTDARRRRGRSADRGGGAQAGACRRPYPALGRAVSHARARARLRARCASHQCLARRPAVPARLLGPRARAGRSLGGRRVPDAAASGVRRRRWLRRTPVDVCRGPRPGLAAARRRMADPLRAGRAGGTRRGSGDDPGLRPAPHSALHAGDLRGDRPPAGRQPRAHDSGGEPGRHAGAPGLDGPPGAARPRPPTGPQVHRRSRAHRPGLRITVPPPPVQRGEARR